jgi:hypothetical protein
MRHPGPLLLQLDWVLLPCCRLQVQWRLLPPPTLLQGCSTTRPFLQLLQPCWMMPVVACLLCCPHGVRLLPAAELLLVLDRALLGY